MADLPSGISWSLRRHLEVVSVSLGLPSTTLGFVTVFPSGSRPMGPSPFGDEWPFHRSHLRPADNTATYIMIHDSSEITILKKQQVEFYGWGHHTVYYGVTALGSWRTTALEPFLDLPVSPQGLLLCSLYSGLPLLEVFELLVTPPTPYCP